MEEESNLTFRPLSPLARQVLSAFERRNADHYEGRKITVNPIVSKFASWYERLRNAMEYHEEEVVLRSTIERIIKRRLLLGGNAKTTAEPLVKELLWARYLPDNEVSELLVHQVEESIDLHLALRLKVMELYKISDKTINPLIYQLISSDLALLLRPNREKEVMASFMFHVLCDHISIIDDTEETRNAQVFLAVRRAFARDDLAFLRYHLFGQYFGKLTRDNFDFTVAHFMDGYKEITRELAYPAKDRIYTYAKRRAAAFFILEDVLRSSKDNLKSILENEEALQEVVFEACRFRYNSISSKVRRAVVRSVIFILLSKVAFAFAVEGTYDRIFFGRIIWQELAMNISIPPLLMVVVSLFIRTPGQDNSKNILAYIEQLLYAEHPRLGNRISLSKAPHKRGAYDTVFNILWFLAFIVSFGAMSYVLTDLHFNVVSQFVFIFFLAIVSFLSYRISLTAGVYRVGEKQGWLTPIIDFFFMPVVRVGRRLTQTVSQINFFLFLFDFFIEAPFKSLFAFFDQLFYFLHAKTEELE
jgi:hypothetical protein